MSTLELEATAAHASPEKSEACWAEIGVYGQRTCPELRKFVHCRSCPVYSEAGVRLLDRPLPQEFRREWSEHFAKEEQQRVQSRSSAVVFRIGSEWLGLPTTAFQEVAEFRRIHALPHRRGSVVLGLVNIRGELLICVALNRVLGMESGEQEGEKAGMNATKRLLVVVWQNERLVFPVDEIEGIYRFQTNELKEPPPTLSKSNLSFTRGLLLWERRSVGLLHTESLFPALNQKLS